MDGGVGGGDVAADQGVTPPAFLNDYSPEEWSEFFAHMQKSTIETERQLYGRKNPEAYEALVRGTWTFGQSPAGRPNPTCAATFWTRVGGVILLDWAGEHPGSALAFFGMTIPRSSQLKRVALTLTQSGDQQSVQAFQSSFPLIRKMGMFMFAVPSTAALLSSIEDRQDFAISMSGREIVSGEWHSGHVAKKGLRDCIDARTKRISISPRK